jgi:hypothetical protein
MQLRMRQMCLLAAVAVALVVLCAAAFAQSSNSLVGTWKLNVAKSKYNAGAAPKSGTTTFDAAGPGIKATVDTVAADGTKRHWTYTASFDGKDNPIVGNATQGDVVALTRVDANTTKLVYKKDGNVTVTSTTVVSGDGKTRTVTTKGKDALGQNADNVNFYDKQ